jgi:hypothetical protein
VSEQGCGGVSDWGGEKGRGEGKGRSEGDVDDDTVVVRGRGFVSVLPSLACLLSDFSPV